MFVFKKYDRQNHVWSFMTKYLRFLCKFTSWSCGCIEKQIRWWKNCWNSYVYVHISLFLPEWSCTTVIDISPRIFILMHCCLSIIIVICIVVVCYLYMPSWGPDLVNKLISISYNIDKCNKMLCLSSRNMIDKTMCEVLWRNISDFYVNLHP